jgi:hypothetical protein
MLQPFSALANTLAVGDVYEHYSKKQYRILAIARHSETLEEVVVYQSLYGAGDIWVRPLNMFLESVVIDGVSQPRFTKLS